jgi:hypothetical protein
MTLHAPARWRTKTKSGAPHLAGFARRGNTKSKNSPLNIVIPTGAFHPRKEWEAVWRDVVFARTSTSAACGRTS